MTNDTSTSKPASMLEFKEKLDSALQGKIPSTSSDSSTPPDLYDHEFQQALDSVDSSRPTLSDSGLETAQSLARSTRAWSRDFLETSDAKFAFVRDTIANYNQYVSDLGGFDQATMAQRELCKRAATLGAMCRILESRITEMGIRADLDPKDFNDDFNKYLMTTKVLHNVIRAIGLKRTPKDITNSLEGYAKHKYG